MTNPDEIEEMVRELRAPVGEDAPAIMEKAAFLILRLAAASPAQPTREEIARTIHMSRGRFSCEGTEEHFSIYAKNPHALGELKTSVFLAYRDADAVLALFDRQMHAVAPLAKD